ncbi:hypothetical protein EMPS_06369 [Entomortierella parvispora]|uniref:BHLH domain-containing protein n=1 Tax=Entomortierella parvispora TaxID=205924 RepID=A0A9P3HCG2_9FUNG|nr:hypothetical protein EMPS_06369 [Entomortierella parvispora]
MDQHANTSHSQQRYEQERRQYHLQQQQQQLLQRQGQQTQQLHVLQLQRQQQLQRDSMTEVIDPSIYIDPKQQQQHSPQDFHQNSHDQQQQQHNYYQHTSYNKDKDLADKHVSLLSPSTPSSAATTPSTPTALPLHHHHSSSTSSSPSVVMWMGNTGQTVGRQNSHDGHLGYQSHQADDDHIGGMVAAGNGAQLGSRSPGSFTEGGSGQYQHQPYSLQHQRTFSSSHLDHGGMGGNDNGESGKSGLGTPVLTGLEPLESLAALSVLSPSLPVPNPNPNPNPNVFGSMGPDRGLQTPPSTLMTVEGGASYFSSDFYHRGKSSPTALHNQQQHQQQRALLSPGGGLTSSISGYSNPGISATSTAFATSPTAPFPYSQYVQRSPRSQQREQQQQQQQQHDYSILQSTPTTLSKHERSRTHSLTPNSTPASTRLFDGTTVKEQPFAGSSPRSNATNATGSAARSSPSPSTTSTTRKSEASPLRSSAFIPPRRTRPLPNRPPQKREPRKYHGRQTRKAPLPPEDLSPFLQPPPFYPQQHYSQQQYPQHPQQLQQQQSFYHPQFNNAYPQHRSFHSHLPFSQPLQTSQQQQQPPPQAPTRRLAHILSEQKRREKINGGFDELKGVIPECAQNTDSKATILRKAVDYILLLEDELRKYIDHFGPYDASPPPSPGLFQNSLKAKSAIRESRSPMGLEVWGDEDDNDGNSDNEDEEDALAAGGHEGDNCPSP